MAKVIKSQVELVDTSRALRAEAEISPAQIKRIIRSYERAGIFLEYYTPAEYKALDFDNQPSEALDYAEELEACGLAS
jgi:hypothetical protein